MLLSPLQNPRIFTGQQPHIFSSHDTFALSSSQRARGLVRTISFLESLQANALCLTLATTIYCFVLRNNIFASSLYMIVGSQIGLLVKKAVAVYTLRCSYDRYLLELQERYPYAYPTAVFVSILASVWIPTCSAIMLSGLGFLHGYMFYAYIE